MITSNVLEVGTLLIGLCGGLALFLFGMELMTDALKLVAGGGMKRLLARLTTNRFYAAGVGAFVTAVIQSSSVTTVLVVGFISAGLMTLAQSVGVIIGANIGTTITAQIIAFKVTQYALIIVAIGVGAMLLSKKERIQHYGKMLLGLGLVFFGMDLMSEATEPLRTYAPFIDLMQRMENPALGILVSAIFTGLIQSSSATTGVIIVLASQGFISLEAGIALVFGANIGTCITAMLAAIGKPREAIQAAVVHVIFNVAGVLIWLAFIDQLAWLVREISPLATGLVGTDRLAAETPRQIANAHTVFNVANCLLFIWLVTPMAWLVQRIVPKRAEADAQTVKPRYLDDILLETPALALDRVRMEMRRLGERAFDMVKNALPTAIHGTREELDQLAKQDDEVDVLHDAIVSYLRKLSQQNLHAGLSQQLSHLMMVANNMESIGDMVESNIVDAGRARLHSNVLFSAATEEKLKALHDQASWAVQLAFQAFDASDAGMAQMVIDAKSTINQLATAAENHLAMRLAAEEQDRLTLFKIESEIIEYLKRVYYFAKRISKSLVEEPLAMAQSPESVPGNES